MAYSSCHLRLIQALSVWVFLLNASSLALTWNAENQADANTILLYHFNEDSGTSVSDSSDKGRNTTLTRDFRASESENHWLSSGNGRYLKGYHATSGTGDFVNNVTVTNMNWNLGLTISFWYRVRDEVGSPNNNSLVYVEGASTTPRFNLGTDTFGTGGNGRLSLSVGSGLVAYGADHIWRHLAIVFNPYGDASTGGVWNLYMDNTQVGNTAYTSQNLANATNFSIRFMSGYFNSAGLSADMDEVLVQNGVITDFSKPYIPDIPETLVDSLFSPGGAGVIGATNIEGKITFTNTAFYQFDLSNSAQDSLVVDDVATLGGTLSVVRVEGELTTGQTFTALTARAVSGTFAATNLPSGYTWEVHYTGTDVTLRVLSKEYSVPISPGDSGGIGTTNINENILMTGSSGVTIDLGLEASDNLNINGSIVLNGTLTVSNVNGRLVDENVYTVMTANAISGAFAVTNLPSLASGFYWAYSQSSTQITITVVDGRAYSAELGSKHIYWGGGSTDIANGTPIPTNNHQLRGIANKTTYNWANDAYGNTYSNFSDHGVAVLRYTGTTNASGSAHAEIALQNNIKLSGLLTAMQSVPVLNQLHYFYFTNSVAKTITLTGTNFLLNTVSHNGNRRGLYIRHPVTISGSAPMTKFGDGTLTLLAKNTNYTGNVRVMGGILTLPRDSTLNMNGEIPAVTNISVKAFPRMSVSDYSSTQFPWPTFNIGANNVGQQNQLNDNAVVTLSRGSFIAGGAANGTNLSSESMGKIVLEPQGYINFNVMVSTSALARAKFYMTDPVKGIDRGLSGRGTLFVDSSLRIDIVVSNGVSVGDLIPWMAGITGGFFRLNNPTRILEHIPPTLAPSNLNAWVTASDYLVGGQAVEQPFIPTGEITNLSINSLGFVSGGNTDIQIASGHTLTIASGAINLDIVTQNTRVLITGGKLTSGNDELFFHTGIGNRNHYLRIDSEIADPPGQSLNVIKTSAGMIMLGGTVNNTYSGTTYVNSGVLELNKTNAIAIPGPLEIEWGASVTMRGLGNQIPISAPVTIKEGGMITAQSSPTHSSIIRLLGGFYQLNSGYNVTLNNPGTGLQFDGGMIYRNGISGDNNSTISLQTDVGYASSATEQAVWNLVYTDNRFTNAQLNVELDGGTRTFNIANSSSLPADKPEMVFYVPITDGSPAGGRLVKSGSGVLRLTTTNSYTGGTTINAGTLHVANHSAPARTGVHASLHGSGTAFYNAETVTFHEPIATNLLIGQKLSGQGIYTNRAVRKIFDAYNILVDSSSSNMDVTNLTIEAISRTGTLGTGSVTNNGGTLLIDAGVTLNNLITINGGAVTNNGTLSGIITLNGGTLTGTGTNSGQVVLYNGTLLLKPGNGLTVSGTLSPAGSATGTLEVAGNLTWNGGSSFSVANDWFFNLGPNGTSDLVNVSGDFVKGSGSAFRFDFGGFGGNGTFKLVDWSGTTTFSATDFSSVNLAPGYAATFSINGSQLNVEIGLCSDAPVVSLGTVASRCSPASDTSVTISHTTTKSPATYSIDFSDEANANGFIDIVNVTYTESPLPFTIPAGIAAGTYTATVYMTDASGCFGTAQFTVTINAAPATPGVITQSGGGTTVCYGTAGVTYSINPVSSATAYVWTPPNGATIVSGQNTTSIVLNWGTAAPGLANLSVRAANACGTSADRTTQFDIIAQKPNAPTATDATDVSISSFIARWDAPSAILNADLAGYYIDVSTASDFNGGYTTNNGIAISNYFVQASSTSLTLTNLVEGATYYYRVRAFNACGSSTNSATIEVLTPQILAGWNMGPIAGASGNHGESPYAVTVAHPALLVGGLTRGSGVTQNGVGIPGGWGGNGWGSSDAATAIAQSRFATFTVTAASNNFVSFKTISKFDYRRDGSGPVSGTLQFSKDGVNFTDITNVSYSGSGALGASVAPLPIMLSGIAALQNVPAHETVTFRLVNHGAASTDGTWYFYDRSLSSADDFEIGGTVCSNPPLQSVTGGGSYCYGGTGVNIGLDGSAVGVTYYLYRNSGQTLVATRAGTGGSISFGLQTIADTYTVTAIRNSGGCGLSMNGSAVVSVTIVPNMPVSYTNLIDETEYYFNFPLVLATNDNQVLLAWNAPDGTVTGYRLTRSTTLDGSYAVVAGGSNLAGTNFTDNTAFNGNTYYYKVTPLNGSCVGNPSDAIQVVMGAGCPPGNPPILSIPGNRSGKVGAPLTFAVQVSEISEACDPPFMTNTVLPAGITFTDTVNNQLMTRNFSWVPAEGQQGSYPVTFTAIDSESLTNRKTMTLFVGSTDEIISDPTKPPPSLSDWAVPITNVAPVSGSDFKIIWGTNPQVGYDVYKTTNFPAGPWVLVDEDLNTADVSNELTIAHSGEKTYIQVVPSGTTPGTRGVWSVMTPTIPTGYSMQAPPIQSDGRFDGELGNALAAALPAGTEILVMSGGANPSWTTLRLTADDRWVVDGTDDEYTTPLPAGQGYYINRPSGSDKPVFSGPVGNTGASSINLQSGYNMVGISQGKTMAASTAFESATPVGSYTASSADQVYVLNTNGSWRILTRRPNGTWRDNALPANATNTTLQLTPGQSYYYIRRGDESTLSF